MASLLDHLLGSTGGPTVSRDALAAILTKAAPGRPGAIDVRLTPPPVTQQPISRESFAPLFPAVPQNAMPTAPEAPVAANAKEQADPEISNPELADKLARLKAMQQDVASLKQDGLPGYHDKQAITDVGMAPGPYQMNMNAGPDASRKGPLADVMNKASVGNADAKVNRELSMSGKSVTPAAKLRGSTSNAMRERFNRLASAGSQPTEAELAAAEPRGNTSLTPKEFLFRKEGDLKSARDKMTQVNTEDFNKPAAQFDRSFKANNEQIAQLNPTEAQGNTYLHRMAKMRGISPDQVLQQNAATHAAAQASNLANRLAMLKQASAAQNSPQMNAMQMLRMYGPEGARMMLEAQNNKDMLDLRRQEVQANIDHNNRISSPEYLQQVAGVQAEPGSLVPGKGGPMLISDPVRRSILTGTMSQPLIEQFNSLEKTANLPGPDWWRKTMPESVLGVPTGGMPHQDIFDNLLAHFAKTLGVPAATISPLVRQWYQGVHGVSP